MSYSTVLISIASSFAISGMFSRTLGFTKRGACKAVFVLFCVWVLNGFVAAPFEEAAVSPGCLALATAAYSAAVIKEETNGALSLLTAAASGAFCAWVFTDGYASYGIIVSAVLGALLACFLKRPYTTMASASLAPLFTAFLSFVFHYYRDGYANLALTEEALTAQLLGVLASLPLSFAAISNTKARRTSDREQSYERTI